MKGKLLVNCRIYNPQVNVTEGFVYFKCSRNCFNFLIKILQHKVTSPLGRECRKDSKSWHLLC